MDDFKLAAAGVQRFAVGRETEAVERLFETDAADYARMVLAKFDDDDFVFTIARMENGGILTVGVQRDIDGKIAEGEVYAGRPQ